MKSYKSYQKLHPHIELWKNYKGELHNENGPAVIGDDIKKWYLHGKRHREDGPAKIWPNGKLDWYINDWHFDFNRWKKWVKLSEEELTVLIITYGKERLYVE